ncbi:uncharacterized protein C8Q71DRAFT_909750 [Rhodofomes roseus]|uniref:Uncharacterized protein n=1 Tax=Rhodofomes roseus TaxID=34475 RepID=A0ABQ8K984_9APHY|nr:uncharacterized protein C8Q71DRAFT_909750 [Rhodofomes roseus]KAH9833311.1 hypothetical protein C8Q71DRAFT_909750 [Rhodofomes roseus]
MSSGSHAHTRANEPTQKPPSPMLRASRGTGSPKALWGGIAAVTAGLAGFWYYQKSIQVSKEEDVRPGAIPTWEYRLQQQQDPVTHPNDPLAQRVSGAEHVSRPKDVPLPGSDSSQGKGGSAVLTAAHGKGSEQSQGSSGHVDQPPQMGRTNDQGDAAYSKNSEYTDSNNKTK